MALDAVELAFVALAVPEKTLFGPVAYLDTTVFTDDMVALLL